MNKVVYDVYDIKLINNRYYLKYIVLYDWSYNIENIEMDSNCLEEGIDFLLNLNTEVNYDLLNLISYAKAINIRDDDEKEERRMIFAKVLAEDILVEAFDWTNFILENNIISSKDVEIFINLYQDRQKRYI